MNGRFRYALTVAAALVLCSFILSSSYLKAKRLDQTIRVTGSAKKRIKSDLMIWSASVSAEGATLADGYAKLSRDVEKTRVFLIAQGFPDNQIVISAVSTTTIRAKRSGNDEEPSGKKSLEPEYLYTRLAETKVVILAEAARDAKERAQQIASSTGSKVGEIRSAEMGVLQITSADANNVSDDGENDTKSLEKDVNAVVHVTFAVE